MSGCSDSCLWLFQVKKLSLHLGGPLEGLYFIQVLWVIVEPFSGLKRRKAPIWLLRFLWCYESVWSVVFAFWCTSFMLVIIDDRMIDALGVLFYKLWKDKYKVHPFFCLKFTLDPLRPAGRPASQPSKSNILPQFKKYFVQPFFNISSLHHLPCVILFILDKNIRSGIRIHHDTRKS